MSTVVSSRVRPVSNEPRRSALTTLNKYVGPSSSKFGKTKKMNSTTGNYFSTAFVRMASFKGFVYRLKRLNAMLQLHQIQG